MHYLLLCLKWRPWSASPINVRCDMSQDEVRALGRLPALNVPEAFTARHPFPGAQCHLCWPQSRYAARCYTLCAGIQPGCMYSRHRLAHQQVTGMLMHFASGAC